MRLAQSLLFILLLLTGQVHFCSGAWELPEGRACFECPRLEVVADAQTEAGKNALDSNDCRSCCKFVICAESGKKHQAVASAAPHLDVANLPIPLLIPPAAPARQLGVCISIEEGFPNAPPLARSSRGPPSPLM